MEQNSLPNLIHANFFFTDAIGLSDPQMSTRTQLKKIETLHEFVKNCKIFKETSKEARLVVPTGDGMCIAFLQGIDLPLKLAIELQEKLDFAPVLVGVLLLEFKNLCDHQLFHLGIRDP